jgi:dienelactone hydrolase
MREIDATVSASLPAALAPPSRDYTREQPAGNDEYRIYAAQYAYDATPLEPRPGPADDSSPYWRHEVITIAATYGGERLPIHLFLPKNVKPPYQTVLYFPGSNAIRATTADVTGAFRAVEFIVMSGRAVALPVYKFTFDRSDPKVKSSMAAPTRFYTDWIRQAVTDARRALDYLQTRADVDANALAFCGLSWGARLGPIPLALETRFKAGVLLLGGLQQSTPAPEADTFTFAPRVRVPVLMINGDQDFIFPVQTSQRPLFDALGTPAADKKHVLYPGGHEIVGTKRNQVIGEVVSWLDKYVGRVK